MSTPLEVLLADTGLRIRAGQPDRLVTGITTDSRQVRRGNIFVAVPGTQVDGHRFIQNALASGAEVIVTQTGQEVELPESVVWLEAENTARAAGLLAASYYEFPSRNLELVGITGTNGKTTVATLCHQLFTRLGYTCGLIGTVEIRLGNTVETATHTTPDAVTLQKTLARMVEAGCTYVFMEVSSHALDQNRTAGCSWAGGIFTNISHDHLDYHGNMLHYIAAKKLLFDQLPPAAFALVNFDDKRGAVMLQNTAARRRSFALRQPADYKGRILEDSPQGLHLLVNNTEVYTRLTGKFNALNLLAAFGAAVELGLEPQEALAALSAASGAAGRMERVEVDGLDILGIVDYAHTPDALRNVLETLQAYRRTGNRLLLVFGCGGDRDADKRPVMGRYAAGLSDLVFVTDDNPRSEDAGTVRADIIAGIAPQDRERVFNVPGRELAIQMATRMAGPGDVILVAGKGHETYQEINGTRFDFDDRTVLREYLRYLTLHPSA